MRLMGKRQIGQLEVTDLVTTFILSEIATLPIENPDMPIINAMIPIIVLLTFEVVSSTILSKNPKMKNIFSSRPGYLIYKGKIDQSELTKNRISLDELISELRQNNVTDISEVNYAILEQDGKITVIPKSDHRPLTPKDMNLKVKDDGLSHIIISNGVINDHGLKVVQKDRNWLFKELQKRQKTAKDIYLMTITDASKINIIPKETGTKRKK